MIFQRIIQPDSKLALVENYQVTPLKHFLELENELDLQSLYRSLEVLEENFPLVEKYLYQLAGKQFNQNKKELYYDITSSYFEGNKCIIAEYGYSRDKRKDLDGTFLIQTNEENYSKKKLLDVYKNLSKVENAFKIIKNDLDIRPMFHRKENRVKGHVYICVISYFLMMAIEHISKNSNLNKSARNILRLLNQILVLILQV